MPPNCSQIYDTNLVKDRFTRALALGRALSIPFIKSMNRRERERESDICRIEDEKAH